MSTTYLYHLPVEQTQLKVDGQTTTTFTWEYDEGSEDLLRLYAKGKKQQWDAADRLDWSQGDVERGRSAFISANCASCHSGSQAVGPDLNGVAGRFSRADLFTAIVQPSRDVPPRYQSLVIETADGKIYQGLVIYEAVDGLILQTGAATTVRIAGDQITARGTSPISLMPAGLLDNLGDRDIADLYAYLRSLK